MRYEVMLIKSDEGYASHCPALPACWSQGYTREEALENIRIAIVEYLDYLADQAADRKKGLPEAGHFEGRCTEWDEIEIGPPAAFEATGFSGAILSNTQRTSAQWPV